MAKKSSAPAKATRSGSTKSKSSHSGPLDLASPLSAVVQILSVVLAESTTRRSSDAGAHDGEVRVAIDIGEIGFGRHDEEHQFFIKPEFQLNVMKEKGGDSEPLLVIKASFALLYKADSLDQFSDEHIQAFAKTNGIFNAWPYWREFAQNMTVRMGLPPITVPVFRFPRPE